MARRLGILLLPFCFLFLLMTTRPATGSVASDLDLYLPVILNPPRAQISRLEVSQGIQDTQNNVPLVAERPTLLRVYVDPRNSQSAANISLSVTAERGGGVIGTETLGPRTVSGTAVPADLESTFNLLLPASWLSGDVNLRVAINGGPSAAIALSFLDVPDLNIRIVPIRYTHLPNGRTYLTPNVDTISDWIMRTYPVGRVNVSFHQPQNFTGNLENGTSWSVLLGEIRDLPNGSNPPDQVFYGLIPADWFSGGIAGLGYINRRASIGLNLVGGYWGADTAGELAAHEIGHNFGRYHVNCAPGGNISGVDPNYPYDPETIGQYGVDGFGTPPLSLIAPDAAKDVMSYCDPVWVSDYTYEALLADQLAAAGSAAAPTLNFVVTADVAADGTLSLDPIYILETTAETTPLPSTYIVNMYDAAGNLLGRYPADLLEAAELGVTSRRIEAFIPVNGQTPASLQIVEQSSDVVLAEQQLRPPLAEETFAAATLLDEERAVLQLSDTQPVLLRVSLDNGRSWHTIARDVTGEQMELDFTTWPGGEPLLQIIPAQVNQPYRQQINLPVSLPDQPPQVWISGPTEIQQGAPELLLANATDLEDGALQDLHWSVNGAPVSAGGWLSLQGLPVGEHQIVVRVNDREGQPAFVSHKLIVLP